MIAVSLLFFLSGAAGLIYQIVWMRMLLLSFGATITTVVAVVSVFMAGLAMGSWLVSRIPKRLLSIRSWAILEICIGISTAFSPVMYLMIVPATIAMGATLPILIHAASEAYGNSKDKTTSLLYGVNTLGAIFGTLLSAYIFIELMGLRQTVWTASAVNIAIGIAAFFIFPKKGGVAGKTPNVAPITIVSRQETRLMLLVFAVSGLISLSYEILWTRMLTPISGTFIYAFAFILGLYLVGIAAGSFLAPFLSRRIHPSMLLAFAQVLIGMGAFASLVVASSYLTLPIIITQIGVILPATIGMGMTFPIVTRAVSDIAKSYTVNTIGSFLGPWVAAFVLLPIFGTQTSILLLAAVNMTLAAFLVKKFARMSLLLVSVLFVLLSTNKKLLTERTIAGYINRFSNGNYQWSYLEDKAAAVLGFKKSDASDYGLLVDGVGMSVLVDETKLMAHVPLLVHPNPKRFLVIAFGMGTTFRSGLTYDIPVDAVELVPSVPKMFPIFFADAKTVTDNPNGNIIIDDGRNYVRTTREKYDAITIDPPPPVNSAGTTVLYSREFYQHAKKILNPGGMVSQWFFYGTSEDDYRMLLKSFVDEFPYVLAFRSPRNLGLYLLGSESPIAMNKQAIRTKLADNPKILADLNEWGQWDSENLISLYATDRQKLLEITKDALPVTDDHPRTEYFLLRHTFTPKGIARDEVILK